jgi:glycerol-3-phosphate dehydrogenase
MATHALDFRNRQGLLDGLDGGHFDLVIIGGGVTGAGIARDGAMRGLSVALVEARDFAAGASSRSSKMIHGGLRYMAQGDLKLVQEAASERKAVEQIAPHLTRLMPFVIPAKNAAAIAKLRTGLWAFEKLGGVAKDRRHTLWSRADLETFEPSINADDLAGAIVYPEYLTDDAKLTLANLRSAACLGAIVASYAPVEEVLLDNGRATGVVIGDGLTGQKGRARLYGKVIINAAGPWVDSLRRLETGSATTKLTLTKGVHLVVPKARLPLERTVIMTASDRRSVFAVPKGDMTYLGTTDTFYPDSDYWPRIDAADANYLLAAAAQRFSTEPLTFCDIVSAWSGLRPLVAEEGKSASDISRKDEIWTGPGGVLSIAGGKLTAYRMMAERVVDMAEQALGRKPQASHTATTPLPGGEVDVASLTAELTRQLNSPTAAERLVGLYGAEASSLLGGPAIEARHAVLFEGALTLEDYWVRRSARAWFDDDGGLDALPAAAESMAALLGWTPQQRDQQVAQCRQLQAQNLAFLSPSTTEIPA